MGYAWVLGKQKRDEEAKTQAKKAREIVSRFTGYFEHVAMQVPLLVPREVDFGKDFVVRIYVVNVSRKPCVLSGVEGLSPPGFKIETMPDCCSLKDDLVVIKEKSLSPFQVKRFKFGLRAMKLGVISVKPRIIYFDDLGRAQAFEIPQVNITVKPIPPTTNPESAVEPAPHRINFKSEAAQRAFDYLVDAFVEDYKRLRLPQERSGWRTLMDIARQGKISKRNVYGSVGSRGLAIIELERNGFAEGRVFIGERGRGGKIHKIRVTYENEIVRKQIDLRTK